MDEYAGTRVKMGRAQPAFPQEDREYGADRETSGARITDQLQYQADHLSKTLALIGMLEEKLSPILMSIPVPGDDPNIKRDGGDSGLSELIDRNNSVISTAQREISNLLNRVQL